MSTPDREALKGMLQSMEHMLNTLDAASATATQLIAAQKSGKPLSDRNPQAQSHTRTRNGDELPGHRQASELGVGVWIRVSPQGESAMSVSRDKTEAVP